MAKILFRLRNVPEDEADDVRQILDDNHLPWYETSAGRWGISFPAIWLRDEEDHPRARALLDEYQHERSKRYRNEYESNAANGDADTFLARLLRHPVRFVVAMTVIGVILYFSVLPFFSILGD